MEATKTYKNNQSVLSGLVVSSPAFSHTTCGRDFYSFMLSMQRMSGVDDLIPVIVPEDSIDFEREYEGKNVKISGPFRSCNYHVDGKTRLLLYVFTKELVVTDEDAVQNSMYLDGYICKPPVYRETPLGRKITDIMLAVNRPCGRADYIPCICWGKNALEARNFHVGDHCYASGRLQSREYIKLLPDMSPETHIAYEVSIDSIFNDRTA